MILLFCKIIYWVSIKFTSCDKLFGTFLSVWNASSLLKFRKKTWNSFIFMWNNKITLFFWSLFVVNMTSTLWLVVLYMFSHFFAQIFPGHALLFILKLWARDFEPGHGMAANCQRIVFGAEFSMASKRRSSYAQYKMRTLCWILVLLVFMVSLVFRR